MRIPHIFTDNNETRNQTQEKKREKTDNMEIKQHTI